MARFQNIAAVLFDLDGTLIDSAPDLGAAADKMRTDRGMSSLGIDAYRPLAGSGARGMLSIAFGITPGHGDFNTLREEFFCNYERCMTQSTYVFDGVPMLIERLLQANMQWGVVTNKAMRFTHPLTMGMQLFQSAGTVISGDTTPYAKPHPEPLLEAARCLRLEPSSCLYVGDDERDIQAGKAAGMATVAADYGYMGHNADSSQWGAQAQIKSPLELLQLLVSA